MEFCWRLFLFFYRQDRFVPAETERRNDMALQLIDLSQEIYQGMSVFPMH